jgi:Flp pilus assembly protein TadB
LDDQWGLLLLAIAAALNLGGFLWIRKITTFEI